MEQIKKCSRCKKDFPISHYHKLRNGLRYDCKACRNDYLREWSRKNPEKGREHKYMCRYKIKISDYNKLLEEQRGVCAICNRKDFGRKGASFFWIDHNHSNKEVRGLLCNHCNRLIGVCFESTEILDRAILYLKKHNAGS